MKTSKNKSQQTNIVSALAFAIIVLGGFWVGMQWGRLASPASTSVPTIDYQHVGNPEPVETIPPVISAEVSAPVETVTPPSNSTTTPPSETVPAVTPTNTTVDIPTAKNDKVVHYQSSFFKYGFDMPANVYYAAFGGQQGAQHTVGIAKQDPATLADAAVRVYFYGKKIVPELGSSSKVVDPAGKFIYLLLNGQYSVKIEANDINNPVVQKIVQTITVQ